jgi:hypothetical protein
MDEENEKERITKLCVRLFKERLLATKNDYISWTEYKRLVKDSLALKSVHLLNNGNAGRLGTSRGDLE